MNSSLLGVPTYSIIIYTTIFIALFKNNGTLKRNVYNLHGGHGDEQKYPYGELRYVVIVHDVGESELSENGRGRLPSRPLPRSPKGFWNVGYDD